MPNVRNRIETERLSLRTWRQEDLDRFAALHRDPAVMQDLGGPISKAKSRAKLLDYISKYKQSGFSRYCVEDRAGRFVGYVGICPQTNAQAIGAHIEIGWRLKRNYWGKGYATEAGQACLSEFRRVLPNKEVVSYTTAENIRSQSVMARLGMDRTPERDFRWYEPDGSSIPLLVWTAHCPLEHH